MDYPHLRAILNKHLELYQPHTVPRRTVQRIIDELESQENNCLVRGNPMYCGKHVIQRQAADHEVSAWRKANNPIV